MADPEVEERGLKKKTEEGENDGGDGFFGRMKDFISDVGDSIKGAVGFGKPSADVSSIHLKHISMERADVVVDVLITNPNPIPVPLVDIDYLVESDGRKLISGLIPDAGTVAAHGSETVNVPITLIFDDIRDTYKDIEPGQIIPYKLRVALIIDVPILGRITIPLEKTGEIPIPYKPDVDVDKVEFEHLSLDETTAVLHFKVENKNKFKLAVKSLEYNFLLAEVPVSSANLRRSVEIDESGVAIVELPVSFRPKDLGDAVWDIIRGRGAGYSMSGKIEVDTPFGPMIFPFSKEGGTTRLKKKGRDDDDDDE